jgi:hypothetical protein
MVPVGSTKNGLTRSVEVIDIENPDMICQDLPEYPIAIQNPATFLNFDEEPEICGGRGTSSIYKAIYIFYF